MADKTTVIRNAERILAWNEGKTTHAYVSDGDLAFRGNAIVQVGGRYAGQRRCWSSRCSSHTASCPIR